MTEGLQRIVDERLRQQVEEGYTAEHDAQHSYTELARAALCYLVEAAAGPGIRNAEVPELWPWEAESWKPSPDPAKNLTRGGALAAAALDRLAIQRREEGLNDIGGGVSCA